MAVIAFEPAKREELVDLLSDLQHDLGKYLRLPFSLLPREADAGQVRAALEAALFQTRRGPAGTRGAREIWKTFLDEAGGRLSGFAAFSVLESAVLRALGWRRALENAAPLDRGSVEADLGAVAAAIQALLEEVKSVRQAPDSGHR